MTPLLLFVIALSLSALFAWLATKSPLFHRKEVIEKVVIFSFLSLFFTPILYYVGFWVQQSILSSRGMFRSIVDGCSMAINSCYAFIQQNHPSLLALYGIVGGLLMGFTISFIKRMKPYIKGLKAIRSRRPLDLSLYPNLKVACDEAIKRASFKGEVEFYLLNTEKPFIGVFGVKKPKILISPAIIDGFSKDELVAVILHELGHLEFGDNLWSFLVGALRDVLFFLIPMRRLRETFEEEKEYTVDRWVTERLGDPMPLAYALLKVSEMRHTKSNLGPSVAFADESTHLEKRIRNLLESDSKNAFVKRLFAILSATFLLLVITSFSLGFSEGRSRAEVLESTICKPSHEEVATHEIHRCDCTGCSMELSLK